ncbi:MAG: hypothetical protein WEE53_11850 [Acidimicrobiia bacterium]
MTDDDPVVWVFLVERGLDAGSDLRLFWHETDAIEAARVHLSVSRPSQDLVTRGQVYEVIEAANQLAGAQEYIVLTAFLVTGHT